VTSQLKSLDIYRLIIDLDNDLLAVGLIAQMVECCTGIAEVRVAGPAKALILHAFLGAALSSAKMR